MNLRFVSFAIGATAFVALTLPQSGFAGPGTGARQAKPISNYSINSNSKATTENFSISYDISGYFAGHFECEETRIVKVSPKAFVKDTGTCIVTGNSVAPGSYSITEIGWASDYEYFIEPGNGTMRIAASGSIEVIDNGDGTKTWDFTTYY